MSQTNGRTSGTAQMALIANRTTMKWWGLRFMNVRYSMPCSSHCNSMLQRNLQLIGKIWTYIFNSTTFSETVTQHWAYAKATRGFKNLRSGTPAIFANEPLTGSHISNAIFGLPMSTSGDFSVAIADWCSLREETWMPPWKYGIAETVRRTCESVQKTMTNKFEFRYSFPFRHKISGTPSRWQKI